jgi:diguanylate cyclase (GGDEF)-like protein
VSDNVVASSNTPQNTAFEVIGLIDQLLEALEKYMAEFEQDSEIFLAHLTDMPDSLRQFGESENITNLIGWVNHLKELASDRREREQAQYEQISKQVASIQKSLENAKMQVSLDALMQVPDLECFNCTLHRWIAAHEKSGTPFTLAYFDVDDCRQINEIFGRSAGDRILAFMAMELAGNIRERDFLARCSGDGFAVLSSGMELNDAARRFSKLLQRFETIQFEFNGAGSPPVSFTASCGIAEYACGESFEELTDRAQNALCDAKRLGKNRAATRFRFLLRPVRTGT